MASDASAEPARRHVPQKCGVGAEAHFLPDAKRTLPKRSLPRGPTAPARTRFLLPSDCTEAKIYRQGKELVISPATDRLPPSRRRPAGPIQPAEQPESCRCQT